MITVSTMNEPTLEKTETLGGMGRWELAESLLSQLRSEDGGTQRGR